MHKSLFFNHDFLKNEWQYITSWNVYCSRLCLLCIITKCIGTWFFFSNIITMRWKRLLSRIFDLQAVYCLWNMYPTIVSKGWIKVSWKQSRNIIWIQLQDGFDLSLCHVLHFIIKASPPWDFDAFVPKIIFYNKSFLVSFIFIIQSLLWDVSFLNYS